jgi:signal transduction histidine kinase
MDSLKRALWGLAILGLVAGAVPLALALVSEHGHQRQLIAIVGPVTGWAFVGTGLYVWWRRPDSNFGALMTAVGFSSCLGALRVATEPTVFITGLVFIALPYAVLYHMLLAFPTGNVRNRFEWGLIAVSYASAIVAHPVQVLFQDTGRAGLPENPLLIAVGPEVVAIISRVRFGIGVLLIAALAVILIGRWREAGPAYRRRLLPVVMSGGAVFALFGAWYLSVLFGTSPDLQEWLERARVVALATVPFGLLAGLLHSRLASATAVSDLITRFGDPIPDGRGLRDALAEGLEDPSLELAYWLPRERRYVDIDGQPVAIPEPGIGREATFVERDGRPVGAFIHDSTLAQEPERLRSTAAAVALTLDNERLQAELRARLDELSASRARIVRAAHDERKRIERNLHDGTQQRLTSVAMELGMVKSRLEVDPLAADEALSQARTGLSVALAELRDLSQGIHPGILTERGLGAAVEDLAYASPVPVRVTSSVHSRLDEPVEAAAYYVVGEALANVTKHARASTAAVVLEHEPGQLQLTITDDGVGGADPSRGSGLNGLADRVQALGGSLELRSEVGSGTRVSVVIPCG